MKIEQSKQYDKFKFASFNRVVNKTNLNKLIMLGKNDPKFHLFPIIVDKEFTILDGQHRFEACKTLRLPIYYIKTESNATVSEIYNMNIAGRKHTTTDKIIMLAKDGNAVAQKIIESSLSLKRMNISCVVEALYLGGKASACMNKIETGVEPTKMGFDLAFKMNSLPFPNISSRLCRAIISIIKRGDVDYDTLLERIALKHYMIFDGGREIDVERSIIKAYNHNLSSGRKLAVKL